MTATTRSVTVVASIVTSTALLLGTVTPAQADTPAALHKVSTTNFVDDSCVKQVEEAYEKVGQKAAADDLELCEGKVTVEEGATETVDVGEAKALAATEDMSRQEATQVIEAAKAGKIRAGNGNTPTGVAPITRSTQAEPTGTVRKPGLRSTRVRPAPTPATRKGHGRLGGQLSQSNAPNPRPALMPIRITGSMLLSS